MNDRYVCYACGDAENCDMKCVLYSENKPEFCPISGDECDEWIQRDKVDDEK